MTPVRSILIVGGGTAGWLTACFLAKRLGAHAADGVRITLVESPEVSPIGVGEGTFPSIKGTLDAIGIDEARFIRECSATFKQGLSFRHWVREPGQPGSDHYFHPFSHPSQRDGLPELLPYWLRGAAGEGVAFAQAVTLQKAIADASCGPKRIGDRDFVGPMNYAYHFDAGQFAQLLATHGKSLGVEHALGHVERVDTDGQDMIAAVHTREHGVLKAGLYVDCSGFRARLLGEALGSPWRSLSDVLFVDRALAVQVPYAAADTPIPSYTISTAHEAGWTWDIGLQQRRGIGYVYSSRHTSDARAEEVLRRYVGSAMDGKEPRQLVLNVGYRDTQWVGNCVAIGLAGGFLEPLESSGIGLIEAAAYLLGYLFPFGGEFAPAARLFNDLMRQRYERIVNFIKLHYCLTQRSGAFWRDNADPGSIPLPLQDQLAMWRSRPPTRLDFVTDLEMYPPSSWQYVLYGMEFGTRLHPSAAPLDRWDDVRHEFATLAQVARRAVADLPDHRRLVEHYLKR